MITQSAAQTKTTDSPSTDTRESNTTGMPIIVDRGRATHATKGFAGGPFYEAGAPPFFTAYQPG
jgi:hypothetical protein